MKALKILFGSFLIAVLLVTALALPVWYVYSQGNRFVRESEQVARNRALEMGITLNTLSGESLYYDNLIALSHTMHMVVRQSETRKDAFQIREIFFVDKDGKLIAHSDIAKLAADSGVSYDKDKFQFGQLRFKGDPLSLEVTQRVKPDFGPLVAKIGATPLFERLLAFMLPDLTASDYHLAGSVYMPDEALPSGSLHIVIHNQNAALVLAQYSSTVLQALAVSVLGAGALWIIFTVVLGVLVVKNSSIAPPPFMPHQSLNSEHPEGQDSDLNRHELDRLEEISVNDSEFDPLPGPSVRSVAGKPAANQAAEQAPAAEEADEIGYDNDLEPAFDEQPGPNVSRIDQYRDRKKAVIPPEETADARSKIYDAVPLDRI